MRSFDLLHLSVICVFYALRRLARFRVGEGKSDPPSALSALLSYRSVHEGARRELWAPGKISLSIKYIRWILRFYTVWKQEILKMHQEMRKAFQCRISYAFP